MAKKKRKFAVSVVAKISRRTKIPVVDGNQIKTRRERLGLTLADAAKRAGWKTAVQWHDLESEKRHNPSLGAIVAVSMVLGCKVDDLLRK